MKKINNVMVMTAVKGQVLRAKVLNKLKDNQGQIIIDHALAAAITVGLMAVVLVLFSALLKDNIAPGLSQKISEFFNFK